MTISEQLDDGLQKTNLLTADENKKRMVSLFKMFSSIAGQVIGKIRALMYVGILSVCWITFLFVSSFSGISLAGAIGAIVLIVLLGTPALLLGKLYATLRKIIELPGQVEAMGANITIHLKEDALPDIKEFSQGERKGTKISDIFVMGRSLLKFKDLFNEVPSMSSIFGGVLLIANPGFAIVIMISTIAIILMFIVSVVAGAIYIF